MQQNKMSYMYVIKRCIGIVFLLELIFTIDIMQILQVTDDSLFILHYQKLTNVLLIHARMVPPVSTSLMDTNVNVLKVTLAKTVNQVGVLIYLLRSISPFSSYDMDFQQVCEFVICSILNQTSILYCLLALIRYKLHFKIYSQKRDGNWKFRFSKYIVVLIASITYIDAIIVTMQRSRKIS